MGEKENFIKISVQPFLDYLILLRASLCRRDDRNNNHHIISHLGIPLGLRHSVCWHLWGCRRETGARRDIWKKAFGNRWCLQTWRKSRCVANILLGGTSMVPLALSSETWTRKTQLTPYFSSSANRLPRPFSPWLVTSFIGFRYAAGLSQIKVVNLFGNRRSGFLLSARTGVLCWRKSQEIHLQGFFTWPPTLAASFSASSTTYSAQQTTAAAEEQMRESRSKKIDEE